MKDSFGYPVWLVPGTPVGAGGALTGGLKELPPEGLMLFSVGVTDGALVELSVVLDGAGFSSLPPQAVSAPMEMNAAIPRPAATRRVFRLVMRQSYPGSRDRRD
ncbi:hypothetical protein ASD37_23460 [Mycobacterium sp. Root135]|nr:hypothetical protein ASD37_23460 [Mycobacterium sp. Root135]